jgi:replicative DNA helicase
MPSDITLEKTLPNNLEAERSILGAILLDDKSIYVVLETLRSHDFYLESHRRIFEKMTGLTAQSRPVDLVTLKNELQRTNELEGAGGPAYIASLTDGLPRAINIEHYARIVKEKATLRRLIQISNEIMARSYQSEESAGEILEQIERTILELAGEQFRTGFSHIDPLVSVVYKQIEEVSNRKSLVTGVETGFTELDKMTAGFHPGDLVILAARPSLGKTSLALNIAQHVAIKKQQVVGIFSLEMSKEQLVKRLLCAEAEIDAHKVNTGYLNKEDWSRLGRAAGALSQTRIYIDDSANVSITEMRSKARRLKQEARGLDILVVDYLQLMSGSERRYENRTQEISQISRGLKAIAKELHVPLIAISQLSRAVEARRGDHRPMLSDLRESGSIEQDADVVLFIYREEIHNPTDENTGIAELIIEKQRNGPTGSLKLAFVKQYTKFANLYQEQ